MPHFVIECSDNILTQKKPDEIMQAVYEIADGTGLFAKNDIKVRLAPYKYYKLGEDKSDFLHIFVYIMQGRSMGQKANLSKKITERLDRMFPEISVLSVNVSDFELDAYCNKSLIDPGNISQDRHFRL